MTSSAPNPTEFQVIAQMGELADLMRGQATGTFVEVLLPDGTRARVVGAAFTGCLPFNRTMVLELAPDDIRVKGSCDYRLYATMNTTVQS